MFEPGMIRTCAELYPVELACFLGVALVLVVAMAIITVAMATIMVGG